MELTAGYPFWLIKDGLPFQYPRLQNNISPEVSIIGGGISGALSAYFLTEAGVECVLLDGRTIGLGSTCASTSLLQYELDAPLHQLIDIVGKTNAVRAYQLCGLSIDILVGIMEKIGYREFDKRQSLYYTSHSSQKNFIKKEFEARRNAGFNVEILTRDQIKVDYGMKAEYAILSREGATINAYAFTHALLQYSIQKGLRVYDRTKIKSIKYNSENVELTAEDGYKVSSGKLINASGFEIVNFISKDIVDLYCTYAVISENATEKKELWKDGTMIWNTDDPYLYMRLTKDNRIIIGGRDERFSTKTSREIFQKKASLLQKDFEKTFPDVQFKSEFAWSGTFGRTKDALPYIGEYSKTPNTYYALGFGGNGITFSVVAAQIITDLIKGRLNKDAEIFSFERKS
ncbi:MAG TPA: FAD-dependent oxidoreductase [Puia sp.]|nr:FAD-dependent oxidoreductase [Puia sp.]